ncbi:MAG TPA: hypothetical protein VLG28_06680 [Acidimicrobiia bacterium]|jgi:hypothetical protein|nr:hypothetical protein [Acidimicrobiia bacterium]
MPFDPDFTVGSTVLIHGEFTDVQVLDPDLHPNRVLDPTEPFQVVVTWQMSGIYVPLWLYEGPGGDRDFQIKVFAESMGPGPEMQIGFAEVDVTNYTPCGTDCYEYSVTVNVPANTLPENLPADASGVYKLITTVWLNGAAAGPTDIIGFSEAPVIQVENLD